ncbi:MAG: translation elongation factor Ts [Candidatus Magasanikbacteria bacterium RIFOXYD2_FULL_39_9]|uniref:Elongation factor Ts n=1 Tax=Candidatus Magasanikbacteria bacterium RIFOXYD1_FULL_40_23 TaxID=1798705 RepID=A0A1F6P8P1_9BACT|nr:MAG: translation elongation factor Ts [Candidatus Magasanikbacteria bacterium RIFOXYD1_FULL_40_23]OGH92984.1 MAG: translation elongation factor Ts [Candidatus Magasanikbacteria bacterium RIFOXYD2_FULL_39_9]
MSVTASDVAKLRSLTGAGMMDCKKALDEAEGDMEKAGEILRKKGIVKAAKRTDKIAAEGTTQVKASGDTAVVMELNSETDFVSGSPDFQNLATSLTDALLQNKPADLEQAMSVKVGGETVQEVLNNFTAKIGEKISLRRFAVVEKTSADVYGAYSHLGGRMSVLVVLKNSSDSALATDIAMHAAASNPKYISRDQVPAELVEKEKEIYTDQLRQQGKPEAAMANILKGKLDKFYSEICLLEQSFIKDEEKTVQKLLGENVSIEKMVRFEVGEGIEKEATDFAAEVEAQIK